MTNTSEQLLLLWLLRWRLCLLLLLIWFSAVDLNADLPGQLQFVVILHIYFYRRRTKEKLD